MHVDRHFPAEGIVQTIVLRAGAQILVSAHDVRDAHRVVIHDVCEVIGREAVGLHQDHVVQFGIVDRDVSVDLVMEGRRSRGRVVLADDVRHTRGKLRFHLFLRKMETMLVIYADLFAVLADSRPKRIQPFFGAEAVVCFALLNQLFRIFQVDAGLLAFRLYIGAHAAVLVRTFIMDKPGLLECTVNDIHRAFHESALIGIFNTQHKIAALMLCDEVGIQRSP